MFYFHTTVKFVLIIVETALLILLSNENVTLNQDRVQYNACWLVGWLLNILATCQCISRMDLLRQFYVLPHWDRSTSGGVVVLHNHGWQFKKKKKKKVCNVLFSFVALARTLTKHTSLQIQILKAHTDVFCKKKTKQTKKERTEILTSVLPPFFPY